MNNGLAMKKVILSEVNDIITIYNLVAETEAETGYGKKKPGKHQRYQWSSGF